MSSALLLVLPDFHETFIMETDASNAGIRVVLLQKGHPMAFLSKALSPRQQGLSVYGKEFLAIVLVVEKWTIHARKTICDPN